MEVVKLVWHEHMLGGGTKALMCATNEETAWDFLEANGCFAQDVRVFLNTDPVNADFLKTYKLKSGDTINVVPVQKVEAAVLALEVYVGTAVATALVSIAVSFAINFVISTFFGPSDRGFRENRKDPEGYGLTGGNNQVRTFQPLPLVMGTHRIFPDYASPFFVDYVTDFNTFRDVCNNTPINQEVQLPTFAFSPTPANKAWNLFTVAEQSPGAAWTASGANPAWGADGGQYVYLFGVGQSCGIDHLVAYRWTAPSLGQPWTTGTIEWTTYAEYYASINDCVEVGETGQFDCPSANWRAYSPGTSVQVIAGYGYKSYETTQRLTNVFSYGFGDLRIYDHYIGTTKADLFKSLQVDYPVFSSTGTSLQNWRRGRDTSVGPLLQYPSNCEMVEGGELLQNDSVENDGWVTRETSRKKATYLEVDFAGRLFRNANGGETLTRTFNCEYRLIGASTWTQAPGFPVDFSNGDTTVFRETLGWSVPSGRYEVRVQKMSLDETDSANVNDIVFERFKAYVDDPIETYPAINRLGVQILASGQINGSLDRWSSLASAKCWMFVGSYDGTYPGGSSGWIWQETSNPAWWLLYFCMGGFINKTKPNGWHIGYDPANEERLFGAGLSNDQIDYQSIVSFAKWCDTKNLSFNAVADNQRPCADIMIDIASAGRGSPTWSNGKLGVVWADPADIPVAMFGMGNIIAGSFEVGYNIERRTDEFVASYNDKDDFYISRQVRATVPGVTQPVNTTSLQLYGITSQEQAQREVNLRAADSRYHIRTISFSTSLEGMVPQRGDVILMAHDLTAWAHSGRLVDIDGARITLPKSIDANGWIQIRLPDGTFYTENISDGETNVITLDQALPIFEDSFPEDFIFQFGPVETAGKKCRVLSVEPSGNATVKITCTDDYPEYYAQEYGITGDEPARDERLVAKVFNTAIEHRSDGKWLVWELQNARGVQVSANAIQGSQSIISGSLSVPGLELKLPDYPVGTTLQVTLIPDDVVSATSSISETKTFGF